MNRFSCFPSQHLLALLICTLLLIPSRARADGIIKGPAKYRGSLEERSQEAIIIFQEARDGDAIEEMILKINVEGETEKFAWVVPFPKKPEVKKAEAKLFKELYDYVQYRLEPKTKKGMKSPKSGGMGGFGSGARFRRTT